MIIITLQTEVDANHMEFIICRLSGSSKHGKMYNAVSASFSKSRRFLASVHPSAVWLGRMAFTNSFHFFLPPL